MLAEKVYLNVTICLYLLNSYDSMNQTVQNIVEVCEGCNLGLLLLVYPSVAIFLVVCPETYTDMRYPMKKKQNLFKLLDREKVATLSRSVFVGIDFL